MDYSNPAIQALLPSHLTMNAYSQSGGTAGGYMPWVESSINKTLAQTPYSTYDPRYFQGQETFDNTTGTGFQIQRNDKGEPINLPGAILPSDIEKRDQQIRETMGGGNSGNSGNNTPETNTNAATPGAQRSLSNRRPGLAGGFSGWSGGENQKVGSSNFNYYSRFA